MSFKLTGPVQDSFTLEGPFEGELPVEERPSFFSRVGRKWGEAAETAQGGMEGFINTFAPSEAETFGQFLMEKGGNTLRALMAPLAPIQAVTGTVIGAPVEHALAGWLPEDQAQYGGMLAEMGLPILGARLAQIGSIKPLGTTSRELLGMPQEIPLPVVDEVAPLTRGGAPRSSREYRYPLEAPPAEGSQLELRLPTEPAYRPTLAPVQREIPSYLPERDIYYGPQQAGPVDLSIPPSAVGEDQLPLFTPGRQHTTKVQRFKEIAGRPPSGKEMQLFKNLKMDDIEEMATHAKEVRDLQTELSNPEHFIPPTRALAAATEQIRHAQAAEALGARHVAQDIRESIQDDMTKAMNQWYTGGRPGGTTMAGSVAGSLAGFEQDEDGNQVFDPAKALLGFTAGAVGLTLAQRSQKMAQTAKNFAQWAQKVQAGRQIPTKYIKDLESAVKRQIIIPHTAAEVEPAFGPIYATALKFNENRALIGGMFAEMLGDVTKGVSKKVEELIVIGKYMRKNFTTRELQKMGAAPDDIRQYMQIRTALDYSLDALEQHLIQTGVDPVKAATLVGTMRKNGYFPETRWGNYKIAVEDANGKLQEFYQAESKLAHHVQKAEVKAQLLPGQKMRAYYSPEAPPSDFGSMDVHVMSVLSQIDDEVQKQLTGPNADRFHKMLAAAQNRISGFPVHQLGQKNYPGFSMDVPRVMADYGRSLAQYIARREAHFRATPYVTALAAAGKGNWADYAKQYMKEVTNPTGDYGTLREMLFHYYLAGKISSALVNLSGFITLGYPVIGRYTKNAAKHWGRGLVEATKAEKKLSPDVVGGLRLAKLEGIVSDPTTQELLGTASGRSATLRGLSDLAGAMFGKAETAIRRASYIAGHNIAVEEMGLKGSDAHEFAKRITREANLDYSKADRPQIIRAGWKAPLGTFRLFQWNVLSKFKDAIKRGEYGTLARHVGTLGAVAGLVGMPGAKVLIDVARNNGYDLPTWVREKYGRPGEVALRGPAYAAGALWGQPDQGIDLSGSAGLGDVVPSELFSDPITGAAKLVTGVVVDPLVRADRAKNLLMQGETYRAAEAAMPEAVRALSVAIRAAQEGEFSTAFGEPVVKNPTTFDVATRAMGFQPTAVSRAYEREAAEKSLRYVSTGQSERYYRALAKAIVSQDSQAVQDALQAIQAYNASASPEGRIALGSTAARSAIRRHVLQLTRPEISERMALPKKARQRFQLIQEVYK